MNKLQTIENEVIKLTNLIEINYPELYKYLDETPIATPTTKQPEINAKIMEDYLESLNLLIKHHVETTKIK
jgi:hypothetical protein